ncbi:hypothetical protein [Nocardia terpenica]|uniref:dioxygenase family protein n=1 Tax=Nocardia terpenica TaxID=455432 RepID=UPI0002F3897F|nr:hypothetical protein [Nocardia terpenica]
MSIDLTEETITGAVRDRKYLAGAVFHRRPADGAQRRRHLGRGGRSGGDPVAGVHVDTWHSDGDGFYDVQMPEKLHDQPAMRALLTTAADGRFRYRSIAPKYYPVPTDGPVGEIMRVSGRSPIRPEHIHFRLQAPGYDPLITMLFRGDDSHLTTDPVFGAKRSLVVDFVRHEPGVAPDGTVVDVPFQTVDRTCTLVPCPDSRNG